MKWVMITFVAAVAAFILFQKFGGADKWFHPPEQPAVVAPKPPPPLEPSLPSPVPAPAIPKDKETEK